MSRVSRVPYHQNVYDLLQIEPGESPEAARMIAEHEAQHGPLPASVREWYLVPNMVLLVWGNQALTQFRETIWFDPHEFYRAFPLNQVLHACAVGHQVPIMDEHQGVTNWMIELDGTDDPPVLCDHGEGESTFSAFIGQWFAFLYMVGEWLPSGLRRPPTIKQIQTHPAKPYTNGLWLRVADEPFQPPVIDFLTDQFGEPKRTLRPGGVTTYTYRPPGGTIRITADEPALTGGLSAWWVHAETPERLAEFAAILLPWGTLRETLRADTDPARDVLKRVRGA